MKCVGVDGCRGGWYAVSADDESGTIVGREFATFAAILQWYPTAIVGVDMPIGLPDRGARRCDVEARAFLRPYRQHSVFPAPVRGVLTAETHAEATRRSHAIHQRGMSIQAFNILRKVREVDAALAPPDDRCRVFEVHPEVSFARLNSDLPMRHSKKTVTGRADRMALLHTAFPDAADRLLTNRARARVLVDDVLDALVVLWSASRIERGLAVSLPDSRDVDSEGQRMAITA